MASSKSRSAVKNQYAENRHRRGNGSKISRAKQLKKISFSDFFLSSKSPNVLFILLSHKIKYNWMKLL